MIFLKRFKLYISQVDNNPMEFFNKTIIINRFRFGYSCYKLIAATTFTKYNYYILSKCAFYLNINTITKRMLICKINKIVWDRSIIYVKSFYVSKRTFAPDIVYIDMHKSSNFKPPNGQFLVLSHKKCLCAKYKLKMDPDWLILDVRKN